MKKLKKIFKNIFKKIFSGGRGRKTQQRTLSLSIEGVGQAPLTPEPDDAELAAAALLEMMAEANGRAPKNQSTPNTQSNQNNQSAPIGAAHYRAIADRIREAHEAARRKAMRFVAACEYELQKPDLPVTGPCSLGLLEAELYKRIDIIEREGGELKRRWQHCLAEVTVRLMNNPSLPPRVEEKMAVGELNSLMT